MLEKILLSCRYVSDNSKHVKINYSKLDEVASSIDIKNNIHWLENSPFGILDFDIADIVNFLLVYHSMGFSYWGEPKWSIQTDDGQLDGAYAMMYVLLRELRRNSSFLSAGYLASISYEDFAKLFKGNVEIPLLKQRYSNLKSVARSISERMNGNFYAYIQNVYSDEELFNIIINDFEDVFNDVSSYDGEKVYFYKLAQLLTSDILHIRKIKEVINVDYTHLVGCADYKIPQVLRMLGILEYDPELAQLVDMKLEIEKDSTYEVEIRANMIVAINEISKRCKGTCPIDINDLIWLKGQQKTPDIKPYHLTRTRFY